MTSAPQCRSTVLVATMRFQPAFGIVSQRWGAAIGSGGAWLGPHGMPHPSLAGSPLPGAPSDRLRARRTSRCEATSSRQFKDEGKALHSDCLVHLRCYLNLRARLVHDRTAEIGELPRHVELERIRPKGRDGASGRVRGHPRRHGLAIQRDLQLERNEPHCLHGSSLIAGQLLGRLGIRCELERLRYVLEPPFVLNAEMIYMPLGASLLFPY